MSKAEFLKNLNIKSLNHMQQLVVDQYRKENDLILLSPTGSGKTLAFSLIIMERLKADNGTTQVLIIVPTRELALQIEQTVRMLPNRSKILCVYGGKNTQDERKSLKQTPQILIGTPGRIIYHLERENISFSNVETLILDEFDKSLELGFHDQMANIIGVTNPKSFKMLISATQMEEKPEFLPLKNPIEIDMLKDQEIAPALQYRKLTTPPSLKLETLFRLICKLGTKKILVFCNHREAVNHISELLADRDIQHDIYHGGLEQEDRELALIKFKNGTSNILLSTDLAARGLDIPEVDAIVHYQLPIKEAEFIHRNGRTARMQATGTVYVIMKPEDHYEYLPEDVQEETLDEFYPIPGNTQVGTILINAGKKNKVSKIDIVGYILQIPEILKEDLGLITIKDRSSFVAIDRKKINALLQKGNNGKIKGNKIRIYRT